MPSASTCLQHGVSAIVPAYNEQDTVLKVIEQLQIHPLIDEVIVVSDGSTDKTVERARQSQATVIECTENMGKGEAMAIGVSHATYNIILFADADLLGLSSDMITTLIQKVCDEGYDMFTLVRDRKSETFQLYIPSVYVIGGERVLRREVWDSVPAEDRQGFGVELALNYYAQRQGLIIGHALAPGLHQVAKEQKRGFVRGFLMRLDMTMQCVKAICKLHVLGRFYTVSA